MDILIDFVSSFLKERNEDDAFDRLNYSLTPFLFVLLSLVNISKLYIGTAINCFTKAEFRGGWIQYAHDYCLVENTYFLRTNESIPLEEELRGEKYISYYQWVPFILVLQACSFYLPHLLWRSFNWITGYQIRTIVSTAKESAGLNSADNQEKVKKIARSMFHASQLRHQTVKFLNEQRFVTTLYLGMKLSYVLLICLHLIIFKHFLGSFDFAFGVIKAKGEWTTSGHFPRVTVCDFSIQRPGQVLQFTVECVLPLNMFNEKIFVFFFFWLCLLMVVTLFSILLWCKRVLTRRTFFARLLEVYTKNDQVFISALGNGDQKAPLIANENRSSTIVNPSDLEFGSDMRVVLGLIQDQTGLIFCSSVYKEICNLKAQAEGRYLSKNSEEDDTSAELE